jgi:SAM-dependent methyltransferase
MRRRGWDVIGIEPNPYAANYARTRFGVEVFCGTLEQFDLTSESFDVVALWNVLEHLPTPARDIVRIKRVLDTEGLLVIEISNLESIDRKIFGKCWIGWDLPRHLYLFPRDSFISFLQMDRLQNIDFVFIRKKGNRSDSGGL